MIAEQDGPFTIYAPGKRVCFWGAPAYVHEGASALTKFQDTGRNTGNLFIGSGLFSNTVATHKSFFPGIEAIRPENLHEQYDVIFIAASNFINPNLDLGIWFDYFSRTKLPMFCFGMGSQILPDEDLRLIPGTENFLRLLSDRSTSIGVRGAFTAEQLASMGIFNTEIVGCPSLLGVDPTVLTRLRNRRPNLDKIGINFSNNVRSYALDTSSLRDTENSLFQATASLKSYYILQNEEPELNMLLAAEQMDELKFEQYLLRVCEIFGTSPHMPGVRDILTHRVRVFFEVAQWVSSMETMTASVGSRFHGNIAAVIAGTPALFLAHDMRLTELCEFFHLPCLSMDRPYLGSEILERLLDVRYDEFSRHFKAVRTIWKLFVHRNGLSTDPLAE